MLLKKSDLCVRHGACTDETRYNLNGVRIIPGEGEKVRLVATDGHTLLMLDTENPSTEEWPNPPGVEGAHERVDAPHTVPLSAVELLRKQFPKRQSMPVLNYALMDGAATNDRTTTIVRFHTTDLETHSPLSAREIEGEYPAFEQVIPKGEPTASVTIDARKLRAILKAVDEQQGNARSQPIVIEIRLDKKVNGEKPVASRPVVVRSKTEESGELTAFVMPLRQ